MATQKYENGTLTTLATTELNGLANAARALGVEYNNSLTANLFFFGEFELLVTFGVAPTADSIVELSLIQAIDGTNYADGSSTVDAPLTAYVGGFPVKAVTTVQRIVLRGVPLPPTGFKAHLKNATGQAMAATGNVMKLLPYRQQSV